MVNPIFGVSFDEVEEKLSPNWKNWRCLSIKERLKSLDEIISCCASVFTAWISTLPVTTIAKEYRISSKKKRRKLGMQWPCAMADVVVQR